MFRLDEERRPDADSGDGVEGCVLQMSSTMLYLLEFLSSPAPWSRATFF